jgi:hypothetical protein
MFPCSHGNMFFSTKQKRSKEIKRELFTQGDVLVLMRSPEVGEHPQAHALWCVPLTQDSALIHKPALQL